MRSLLRKPTILVLALHLVLTACVTGKVNYTKPSFAPTLNNSIAINKSKEDLWKEIVPALGKNFFVINNLDKASGLINISYTGDPETYIDCGRAVSTVENLRGERTYDFPAAKAKQVYEIAERSLLFWIDRKMHLEGRMNLVMEELSTSQTRITVSTRYVVTRTNTIQQYGVGVPYTSTDSAAFNSGQTGTFPPGTAFTMECQPTGKFESDVLSLLTGSKPQ